MMLRFSNTELSMLYNLLSAGIALWVILDKLLDKQQFKDGVRREDGVQLYSS
jgi:hypothetical protein